ncbi:hypothetical protein AN958_11816 [Leucoagaricus sp. SymC.cos]|nr:hypothetical protein AN958_11816 [Leucoagaricus sp. SymC.cos]
MCRVLAIFLLGITVLASAAEEKPCTAHADGKYYDLNNLKGRKDFEMKTPGDHKLAINVCQGVTTELWGLKDNINPNEVGGFVHRGHGDFSIGKVNTTLTVIGSRPRLVLSEGSRCKASPDGSTLDLKASTIIEFICDTSVFGAGQPRLVGQLPPGDDEVGCSYFIEWKTNFACPTSEDGGVWGFLAMLAVVSLILLMTYTVLGTLYNRYVLQLRGYDQIPQFSVESMRYHAREAVDWIQDIMAAYNIGGREVSHHTQTQGEMQSTSSSSNTSPPPPPAKQTLSQFTPRRVDLGSRGPTKEEREYMLGGEDGEDDDEEEEEGEDKSTPVTSATQPSNGSSSTRNAPTSPNRGDANTATNRSRDASEGNIRL